MYYPTAHCLAKFHLYAQEDAQVPTYLLQSKQKSIIQCNKTIEGNKYW